MPTYTIKDPTTGKTVKLTGDSPPSEAELTDIFSRVGGRASGDDSAFRQWYGDMSKQYGLNPNPDDPSQFYDYRGAFNAGAAPDASGHWPSQFKRAGHPNMVVGGFNVQTGERVPGTPRAKDAAELVTLGWDHATAQKLARQPEGRTWGDTAADVAIGAVKGVGNTVYGLGKLTRDYTPIGRISDAIQPGAFKPVNKPPELTPTNTAQKIGYGAEQIGEFFLPGGVVGKAAKAVAAGKSGLLTLAQSGSPTAAGVSAGLTAVLPGAAATAKASDALTGSARKEMARALGATKEWAKAEATKLAPEMLKRGVGGSRQAMLALAQKTTAKVGGELDAAYKAAAAAGDTVPADVIQGFLQLTADGLHMTTATGSRVIPGMERAVKRLDKLQAFIGSMGPDIPVDKAAALKRTWDHMVSKAGLYGQKVGATATDSADAWAFREAASAFRAMLNTNPTIAALNHEVGFWTGLKKVLTETEKRTQAQSGGLVAAGMGGSGAVIGAMSGDSLGDSATKAVLGGLAGRQVVRVIQSPGFRTQVTGPMKQHLADALASGSAARVSSVTGRILSSLPARLAPQ